MKGLAVEGEGRRYYPGRELAGPVLGFVAPDGVGKDGLELALDDELRGRAEEVRGLRDRSGRLLFSEGAHDEGALAGHDVQLTIDEGIQHVAERELDAAQGTYETKGASIVVVDPHTGEILAIASVPGYNPNDYGESEVEARRDRAVTDRFEPGSVMKVFTVAGGARRRNAEAHRDHLLRARQFPGRATSPSTTRTRTTGSRRRRSSRRARTSARSRSASASASPRSTRRSVASASASPPGCRSPAKRPACSGRRAAPWFEVETANASFGQGISVTTVQLAVAMGAIANGGKLMEPILVRKISDTRGNVVKEWTPHVRREAVPAGVAKTVAEMLTAVVEEGGTGVEAAMTGFRVAGKTATAQKVDPATGKYSEDKYTASFVGFVPADKPRLVVAVVLDEPMIGRYGGDLAGPVFRRVAEASLRYLGVPPSHSAPKIKTVTRNGDPADATLAAMKIDGAGGSAKGESSKPDAPGTRPRRSGPAAPLGPPAPSDVRVPDAMGMGARDAVRAVGNAGLVPLVEGTGRLVKQVPHAGHARAQGLERASGLRAGVMTAERRRRPPRGSPPGRGDEPRRLAREIPDAQRRRRGRRHRCAVIGVHHDSRRVQPGDLFVVRRGEKHDGSAFVADAVARGAVAILAGRRAGRACRRPRRPRACASTTSRPGSRTPRRPSTAIRRSRSTSSASPARTARPPRRISFAPPSTARSGFRSAAIVGHDRPLVSPGEPSPPRTRRPRPTSSRASSP